MSVIVSEIDLLPAIILPTTRLIYLCDRDDSKFVTVSAEDYDWLMQWKWSWRHNSTGKKLYATRNTRIHGQQVAFYMHVEIMKRVRPRPSSISYMVDHIDRDSRNNVRENLRWASPKLNAQNRSWNNG